MAAAAALGEVHQALTWIGFNTQADHDSICNEVGFESLEDFIGLTEKDIREMADGYEKCTIDQVYIPFGLCPVKLLIGVLHWSKTRIDVIEWPQLQASQMQTSFVKSSRSLFNGLPYERSKMTKLTPSARQPTQGNSRMSASGQIGNLLLSIT